MNTIAARTRATAEDAGTGEAGDSTATAGKPGDGTTAEQARPDAPDEVKRA